MKNRDITILMKIVQYADEINGTIDRFGLDFEKLKNDYVTKNAIAMCILQIGELANTLTDDFKSIHTKMPWREIIAMRNRVAHAYSSMDLEFLWNAARINVPELKTYCENIIKSKESTA
jgi:uncharacterized protein with HEPN domain